MARPKKLTLDFFLHDNNARSDRKIRALRRQHGNDGYATYFCLLEMLCEEDGLRLDLSSSLDLETAVEDCGLRDAAHFYKVLHTCVDLGLFDKQLWESERIVFSYTLHRRYVDRLEERKQAAIRKKRSRDAKALQEKISAADAYIVTQDNPVTTELSQKCPSPELQNFRTTELSELQNFRNQNSELSYSSSEQEQPERERAYEPSSAMRMEAAMRMRTTATLPEWKVDAVQFKPEMAIALAESMPELYKFANGKVNQYKAFSALSNMERRGEFDKLQVLWNSCSDPSSPVVASTEIDWLNHPRRDEWLAQMNEHGSDFIRYAPEAEKEIRQAFARWVVANRQTLAERTK